MNLPEIQKQILNRVCSVMDVSLEFGMQSPQILKACMWLESGLLVHMNSKNREIVKVLQDEMPEA